jgi:trans-aconitate methyltransferase
MSERDFWLKEATLKDIDGDPPVDLQECLRAIIPEIRPALANDPTPSILEIGCGIGRLTYPIKERFPTSSVYGIDVSPMFLNIAQADKRKPKPYFYQTERIVDGPHNAIYSMLVFQHINTMSKYGYIIKSAAKLKPGGILRIQYVEGDTDLPNMHDIDTPTVKRWCEELKLTVTKVDHDLIYPRWTWITAQK